MTSLHAALVTPLIGPLAPFGQAGATGLALWARHAVSLPPPWTGVELDVRDIGSDAGAAMRAAIDTHPDVLFGPYGSSTMLVAAQAIERVVWNHGGATSQLARPVFPRVINVLSPASTYFTGVLQAVRAFDPGAATVSLLHTTSGFGRDVAAGAITAAATLNFEVQTVPFEPYHATSAASIVPRADILLVVGNFADELAVALEPDEGPDSDWFVTKYRDAAGVDPPYPAVQAFAAGLLCARCLRDGGSCDDAPQLAAARRLACTTLYGSFRLDPLSGLQSGHQILIVQWQQGIRRVVWPPEQAERPLLLPLTK